VKEGEPLHPDHHAFERRSDTGEFDRWRQLLEAKDLDGFSRNWLAILCRLLDDVPSAVVVAKAPNGVRFRPVAFWPPDLRDAKRLAPAAEKALGERRKVLVREDRADGEGSPGGNRNILASPILLEERLVGVVALEVPAALEADLSSVERIVEWACSWFGSFSSGGRARKAAPPVERLQMVLDLIASAVQHERFQSAAMAFVTDLSNRLGCDRVSIGFARKGGIKISALSHAVHFGKKTNLVRAIEAAMDEAMDQGSLIVFPEVPGAGFRITKAHEELSREHGAGAVISIPISADGGTRGVLTLERPAEKPFDSSDLTLCETAAALAGPVLDARRLEDRPIGVKVWDWLTKGARKLFGPRHALMKAVAMAIVVILLLFVFAKTTYRVSATMVLEGAVQRAAAAPLDGFIASAPQRAGDLVERDAILCVLDDRDLKLEQQRLVSNREQLAKQHRQAMAQHNSSQREIVSSQIDQVEAQLALVEDQLSRMKITSPFDGIVVKGDLSQALGAPVKKGDVLFEIAPLEDYRVILEVDERDIADVKVSQSGRILLSALPTQPIPFRVEKVTPVSTAREGRNFFRVEAKLEGAPDRLRPGMEGVGKIEIDRRRLIWIWSHRAIDWLRLFFWSWTP
jgi:hypothetical protein